METPQKHQVSTPRPARQALSGIRIRGRVKHPMKIIKAWLCLLCVAGPTQAAQDSEPVIASETLREAGEKIVSFGAAGTVRRAALDWAMMECRRLQDTRGAAASAMIEGLAKDLSRATADSSYGKKNDEPVTIFPVIRSLTTNPAAHKLFDIGDYAKTNPLHPLKAGRNSALADSDALHLAYAALHPQSPARGNPQAIIALLTVMNQSWCVRQKDTWSEQDAIIAYILLDAVYPDLIPATIRAEWIKSMRGRCDRQIAAYTPLLDEDYISRSWLNGDIRNIIHVGFAGIALQDARYRKWMDDALGRIYLTLQPDGATNYTGYQNEAGLYHDAAVQCLAWYWLFSRNPQASDFVAKSARFYPLTAHRFICEEYTAPEQKHYYNGNLACKTFAGCFAGDPFAVAACQWTTSHLGAFSYDPSMTVVPLPDNYTLFDRNIIGPRGRYGNLDFAISTRDFSYYPGKTNPVSRTPDKGFGVTSFLGMRVMNPPDFNGWPMNAVVERVMNRARIGKQEYDKGELIESSVSMAGTASAVSADYMTSGRQGQNWNWGPVPFSNTQAWIINGERAVGFMRIEAAAPVKDSRMSTMFEFVSGRGKWGQRKELVTREKGSHEYGDLRLRVIGTSYKDFEVTYTKGGLSGDDKMRALFRLVEEPGEQDRLRNYESGKANWCLVELRPASSAPAESIRLLEAGPGLTAFTYTASGRSFALVHNPGTTSARANFDMPPSFAIHSVHLGTDGNVDRDKYLNMSDFLKSGERDSQAKTIAIPGRQVSFTIPPKRHILVIASNDPADHTSGMKFYQDVFTVPRN